MGKSTISMAIFNSYVKLPVAIYLYQIYILHLIPISSYSADNLIIHFLTVESLPHVSYIYNLVGGFNPSEKY